MAIESGSVCYKLVSPYMQVLIVLPMGGIS